MVLEEKLTTCANSDTGPLGVAVGQLADAQCKIKLALEACGTVEPFDTIEYEGESNAE